ncbi:unnamed protein product [Anisakis simplex]|uniref:Serine protease F56F10.1 n=1 Tax=Anisakis simplex TaxID=6269 RepID=A0A0M3K9W8_ANISI|nr:unnamed protein product [Anisakis simplex]
MMRYGCILLFVCVINSAAAIFGQNPSNLPFTVFGRPAGGFLNVVRRRGGQQTGGEENTREQTTSFNDLVQTFTITQPIEHGNASLGKWQQRVQYNPAFYKNKEVIFLMIGGQSPISRSWVSDPSLTYLKWAKQYGAAVFQLEHRCFGQSRPYK